MKTSHNKPPHYWLLKKLYGFDWQRNATVFGDTSYSRVPLPDHVFEHEKVHTLQQKNVVGAVIWWTLYIFSRRFRYNQELEAYRVQWQFIQKKYYFSKRHELLDKMASDLSGELYGNIVSYEEARREIQNYGN